MKIANKIKMDYHVARVWFKHQLAPIMLKQIGALVIIAAVVGAIMAIN